MHAVYPLDMKVGSVMELLPNLQPFIVQIDNAEFVATQRNRVLIKKHGRLPSYSLWDASSVQSESRSERIMWFIENYEHLGYYSEISKKIIGPSSESA